MSGAVADYATPSVKHLISVNPDGRGQCYQRQTAPPVDQHQTGGATTPCRFGESLSCVNPVRLPSTVRCNCGAFVVILCRPLPTYRVVRYVP